MSEELECQICKRENMDTEACPSCYPNNCHWCCSCDKPLRKFRMILVEIHTKVGICYAVDESDAREHHDDFDVEYTLIETEERELMIELEEE